MRVKSVIVTAIGIFVICTCLSMRMNTNEEYIDHEIKSIKVDCSKYFEEQDGCVVIFDESKNRYYIYGEELANTELSPYSTFKIISTLMGLHNGVLQDKNSKMSYSKKQYPMDAWNHDLTLEEAFQASCVWYFRQVIDAVGETEVEKELKELEYGNCDVTEWFGSNGNSDAELNGFWLDSSLRISPIEQVQMIRKLFQNETFYSKEEVATLKEIMLYDEINGYSLYGKTGTSQKQEGWYVGVVQKGNQNYYCAVYINGQSNGTNVGGNTARAIALRLFGDV